MQPGPVTTSGALDVIIAVFADARISAGLMAAASGFTEESADQRFVAMVEDNVPTGVPAGAHTPTATLPGTTSDRCWSSVAAAFKAQ
jgi:hypothetical protein